MDKQIYNISYTGLDRKNRIDCQSYIRTRKDPPGSMCLDVDSLCKSNRNVESDFQAVGGKLERGKFVDIGKIEF